MQTDKEIRVDDRVYTLTMYLATKGSELFQGCVKLLGRGGVQAAIAFLGEDKRGEATAIEGETEKQRAFRRVVEFLKSNQNGIAILADAIHRFSTEMSPKEFSDFLKRMMADGDVELHDGGKRRPILFDTDFQGRIPHLFKLVAEIIKFQFLNFLGGASPTAGKAEAAGMIRAQ